MFLEISGMQTSRRAAISTQDPLTLWHIDFCFWTLMGDSTFTQQCRMYVTSESVGNHHTHTHMTHTVLSIWYPVPGNLSSPAMFLSEPPSFSSIPNNPAESPQGVKKVISRFFETRNLKTCLLARSLKRESMGKKKISQFLYCYLLSSPTIFYCEVSACQVHHIHTSPSTHSPSSLLFWESPGWR